MKQKVVVAMSGGVDSSVAAALLVEKNFDVIGIGLRLADHHNMVSSHRGCCAPRDLVDARSVASILKIPFYVMDVRESFRSSVIDKFVSEYSRGRTPVPCVDCNQVVKFDYLAKRAFGLEADFLATGHYAKSINHLGRNTLSRAVDKSKDQTYFLFGMTQSQLTRTMFPLSDLTKERTREVAHSYGLPNADKEESQEICFVPNDDYRSFLKEEGRDVDIPGEIVDLKGEVIGEHIGFRNYTVGQRKGLDVLGNEPKYVLQIIPDTHTLVVGNREELYEDCFRVENVHWSVPIKEHSQDLLVQVRHQQKPSPCSVSKLPNKIVEVKPEDPSSLGAISPGQAAVFYDGDILYGGGWIANKN
ncbi:MAG: tRNA 2-thiouridine(34) synthase MnmA [Nitrospinota bacterium]|nr:tRNA 2-thiouridine(34) synthase MnmA [Nitrospinota bacterium]